MSTPPGVAAIVVSAIVAGAAGWALADMRGLEAKVAVLEATPEGKAPGEVEAPRPPEDDPRGKLGSHVESLERRLAQADEEFAFSLGTFHADTDKSDEEIDAQSTEILGQLAAIKANPPTALTDAILDEQVRAGLLEKRKKDMKKLVKKQGEKNLKAAQEKLKLTEKQMEELKKFYEDMYTEWAGTLAKIFGGEEVPKEELDAKVADTKVRVDTKMKETLEPEQYETWKKEMEPTWYQDPFRGGGN